MVTRVYTWAFDNIPHYAYHFYAVPNWGTCSELHDDKVVVFPKRKVLTGQKNPKDIHTYNCMLHGAYEEKYFIVSTLQV